MREYFDAAGMTETLTNVDVDDGINFREVVAEATADTHPLFLHMLGIDQLDAPGSSGAEQRITNVEIVLVLRRVGVDERQQPPDQPQGGGA